MGKKAWIVVVGCLLVGLAGCGKGNSQDQKEYEEIANYYQNKLSNDDHNILISIYKNESDEIRLLVVRDNPYLNTIYYLLWDREKKDYSTLDPLKQITQDYKEKYMEQGEKVFETTIDYDNKQETPD